MSTELKDYFNLLPQKQQHLVTAFLMLTLHAILSDGRKAGKADAKAIHEWQEWASSHVLKDEVLLTQARLEHLPKWRSTDFEEAITSENLTYSGAFNGIQIAISILGLPLFEVPEFLAGFYLQVPAEARDIVHNGRLRIVFSDHEANPSQEG